MVFRQWCMFILVTFSNFILRFSGRHLQTFESSFSKKKLAGTPCFLFDSKKNFTRLIQVLETRCKWSCCIKHVYISTDVIEGVVVATLTQAAIDCIMIGFNFFLFLFQADIGTWCQQADCQWQGHSSGRGSLIQQYLIS